MCTISTVVRREFLEYEVASPSIFLLTLRTLFLLKEEEEMKKETKNEKKEQKEDEKEGEEKIREGAVRRRKRSSLPDVN